MHFYFASFLNPGKLLKKNKMLFNGNIISFEIISNRERDLSSTEANMNPQTIAETHEGVLIYLSLLYKASLASRAR